VTLTHDVPADLRLEVAAGELEQVVTNLVVNACVHAYPPATPETDPAGRAVRFSARLEGRETLELAVEDHGLGMTPEVAARVFEPFFTTRRGRGGSGLGMHIVHRLVQERFGGTVTLDTTPGRGTRWTVRLPTSSEVLRLLPDSGRGAAPTEPPR
jgi:signal transduction histidine kinase